MMQKWEKLLLTALFILAILGGLLGFTLTKSGIGEIKVFYSFDIFSLLELILLLVTDVCAVFDIYETYESKNELGSIKFIAVTNKRKRFKYILIGSILLSILELGIFLYSLDAYIPPLFCVTILFAIMLVFHNRADDVIGKNGILHWGIYHNWDDIEAYELKNETLLQISLINTFFGFEYKHTIKFDFDKRDISELDGFLISKLQISIDESISTDSNIQTSNMGQCENPNKDLAQSIEVLDSCETCNALPNTSEEYNQLSADIEQLIEPSSNSEQCDQFFMNIEQVFYNINQHDKLSRNVDHCKWLGKIIHQ